MASDLEREVWGDEELDVSHLSNDEIRYCTFPFFIFSIFFSSLNTTLIPLELRFAHWEMRL